MFSDHILALHLGHYDQAFDYQRGGRGRGIPLGLPQDLAAYPPTQADPPTFPPRPPLPPHTGGGGAGLCCYNQLVTQKPCVFAQKNFVLQSLCDL